MRKIPMLILAATIFLPSILIGIFLVCSGVKYFGTVLIILNGIFLFIILPLMIKYLTIDDKEDETNSRNETKK